MTALLLIALLGAPPPEAAVRFECARCHEAPDLPAAPPEKQCVGCHQRILAGSFEAEAPLLTRWQRRLTSLNHAPDLRGARRLRRSWIAAFLQRPFDVRPEQPATMPRLALTAADADALAAWLAPPDADGPVASGDAARGALRLMQLGCLACHQFTGVTLPDVSLAGPIPFAPAELVRGRPRAPDLTWTRDRMTPAAAVAWLQNPTAFVADTPMASYRASDEDARDLVAFLFQSPLLQPPPPPVPATPAPLDRPVRWPEVEARVFKHVCWHCHSDPAYALGDGGPGNTGGFGFPARRLNLASATGLASGLLDATTGQRRSVFTPGPDGKTPLLVAALMARHAEVAGRPVAGVRGMPLGLPPIPLEDVQLVVTWIAQGRPR
ncbi:MAG: cytochrome C oxidase Cbb3 [Myxococcales bacterium]|nr:cytochrome C oxidase Cbb3 [Myxococcales bacterium]